MFDHVVFGVRDYAASKAFFLRALEPLGIAVLQEGPLGVELGTPNSKSSLCLFPTEEKPAHLHIAFVAANRRQVEAFHRAALEAGGKDNGGPGLRPQYHANYYAAFVIDRDGHNIEVVCHEPEVSGTR
jgi:catechol 2,3-dioxygenase-like lactoylglutathione lyase family enzyme